MNYFRDVIKVKYAAIIRRLTRFQIFFWYKEENLESLFNLAFEEGKFAGQREVWDQVFNISPHKVCPQCFALPKITCVGWRNENGKKVKLTEEACKFGLIR